MNLSDRVDFYKDLIEALAEIYKVKPSWIKAICIVESAMNPWATRYEPKWSYLYDVKSFAKQNIITAQTETIHQKTSWGLMQVMGSVAREHGFEDDLPMLCIPKVGLTYGVMHFNKFYDKYGDLEDALASYNAGAPRRQTNGQYQNQSYVTKVMTEIERIERV